MAGEIDRILKNSSKAELLEKLSDELVKDSKMILGIETTYEAYGILEVAKQDLQADEWKL